MDGCSYFQSQKVIRTLCAHPVWNRTEHCRLMRDRKLLYFPGRRFVNKSFCHFAKTGPSCAVRDTGGTCDGFWGGDCDKSRGAQCKDKKCMCGENEVSWEGRCVQISLHDKKCDTDDEGQLKGHIVILLHTYPPPMAPKPIAQSCFRAAGCF